MSGGLGLPAQGFVFTYGQCRLCQIIFQWRVIPDPKLTKEETGQSGMTGAQGSQCRPRESPCYSDSDSQAVRTWVCHERLSSSFRGL